MVLRRDVLEAGDQLLNKGDRHEPVHRCVDSVPDVFMLGRVLDEGPQCACSHRRIALVFGEIVGVDGLYGSFGHLGLVQGGHGGGGREEGARYHVVDINRPTLATAWR